MDWIGFSLLSVFCFTILGLLQRILAVESKNPRATAVVFNATAALIALVIFILTSDVNKITLPTEKVAWISMGLAVFCYGLFERGRFYAAKLLEASVLTTVFNITLLITLIGSFILYSETLTVNKIFGGALILIALFTVSYSKGNKQKISIQGIIISISISIVLGFAQVLDKRGALYFSPETYSILVWVLPMLVIIFPSIKISDLKKELVRAKWRVIVIAAANVLGYLFTLKALTLTEVTRAIPLMQTSTLFTVLAGIVILKERDNLVRKIIAGGLALVGVYFLV
ncbi:hypothetical protein COX08_01970 [Candidatus Beckwithbacteria bacterium CG23_combo_of_CG06-09_8_20_14_all_34_8]|uniref:EamA domain-containing protein n=1 Tax=Candidatus Beckwithbacteria bacterium CG23_combo_of_CG06-09_8_20_14_all_34_8 TaxID=1974497 RepID=A0A2H0B8I8_9BACT|nr:MAG: hypothetical protein COX08_01970 [Candidatus Beckwithbacteria bacterium CG23_combo_of_CG06-09_8_20_14_all_34_8]